MKVLKYLIVPILILIVYLIFVRKPENISGEIAPDFSTLLIDDSEFALSDLRGRYVLLDFWASWCAPCLKENQELVKIYNNFKNEDFKNAEGFTVVTVALEKEDKYWKTYAERAGFNWPYQIVSQNKAVLLSPIARQYNVRSIPAKFLIDPEGKIISVNQSFDSISRYLKQQKDSNS